ncbi:MAG: hypothetical protein HQK53_19955 [Oligoflexia bacterium]|nr:hypothetical protein [Oligoflexia bacterium]
MMNNQIKAISGMTFIIFVGLLLSAVKVFSAAPSAASAAPVADASAGAAASAVTTPTPCPQCPQCPPSVMVEKKDEVVGDDKLVMDNVSWGCKLLAEKGKDAVKEIADKRFESEGIPNYLWINTYSEESDKSKLVISFVAHPLLKIFLKAYPGAADNPYKNNVAQLKDKKKKDGNIFIMQNFIDVLKKKQVGEGEWAPDYSWAKPGNIEPTTKRSYLMKCAVKGLSEIWVVGSGNWR